MKTYAKCLSCMIVQAINTMHFGGYPEDKSFDRSVEVLDYIKTFRESDSPAYNSSLMLCRLYELIGDEDPYFDIKEQSNREAQEYFAYLENIVNQSEDRLFMAFKAAVAGNIIDLGIRDSYNIEEELKLSLDTGFIKNDYSLFKNALQNADSVLILADNSGEIVFDKLLVKELIALHKKVVYMVKGAPVLNDAVMWDADKTGMTGLTEVVTTGAKQIGFDRRVVSPEALDLFDNAPLVIAKGMANFETLSGTNHAAGKTFCVLKAKCGIVADEIGVALDDLVFMAL